MQQNHFDLLKLPVRYHIDQQALEQNYRKLQAEVHPDRFATASPQERLQSMQISTQVNEAYRTLKNPSARARYMLLLAGIDTLEESNTAMPADFLMQQMEWREAADDAKMSGDIDALYKLLNEMRGLIKQLENTISSNLDENPDYETAALTIRKLSFIEKISTDIEHMIDKLEN